MDEPFYMVNMTTWEAFKAHATNLELELPFKSDQVGNKGIIEIAVLFSAMTLAKEMKARFCNIDYR